MKAKNSLKTDAVRQLHRQQSLVGRFERLADHNTESAKTFAAEGVYSEAALFQARAQAWAQAALIVRQRDTLKQP
jgi:S-adenosylmethionine:diacylglycerol 3-amino-3-carboxypropyl transferase